MPRRSPFWLLLALMLLVLLGGIAGLLTVLFRASAPTLAADPPAIVLEIQRLNELVTVRYSIQKVVGMKERKDPIGEESLLLIVQARVLGGVDLSTLRAADVRIEKGHARVRLPQPRVLHVYLDEKQTQVWDRRVTWWTPWVPFSPDLEQKARIQALESVRETAQKMGLLEEARRNAERTVTSLLKALGAQTVTFDSSS